MYFGFLDLIELCAGQVDKLVQLLESPIFLHLRLQLLDVDSPSYPALLKSLYGILMLLPQVLFLFFVAIRERKPLFTVPMVHTRVFI